MTGVQHVKWRAIPPGEGKMSEKIYCPACGAEMSESDKRCPQCKLEYSVHEYLEPDMEKVSDDLISLFRLNDLMEAQLIKTLLDEENIPCFVSEGGMTSVLGAMTPASISFARVRILVPASEAKNAVKALAQNRNWNEETLSRFLTMLDELVPDVE
jgi:hypothetical protein